MRARKLSSTDSSDVNQIYQDFCIAISTVVKSFILHGFYKNYISCWDAECETLYKDFLQFLDDSCSSKATTALLTQLDRKRKKLMVRGGPEKALNPLLIHCSLLNMKDFCEEN